MRSALLVAALAAAAASLPRAAAQTPSYIYTGQAGAQTQIDVAHTSTWGINVAPGSPLLFGGAKLTMKRGSGTSALVSLKCYNGSTASGAPFVTVTLGPADFTSSFALTTFAVQPALSLSPGNYFCTLTSPAADTQSTAYFIKGYVGSTVSTNGSTTTPGTTTTTDAGLTVTKLAPATVPASAPLAYTLQLGNSGATAINAGTVVTVKDQLPPGVSAIGTTAGTGVNSAGLSCTPLNTPGALLTCSVPLSQRLAPGTSGANGASFTINTNAPATAGTVTNYASVNPTGSSTGIPDPATCTFSYCGQASTVITSTATPGLSLTKTCPQNAVINTQITCSSVRRAERVLAAEKSAILAASVTTLPPPRETTRDSVRTAE